MIQWDFTSLHHSYFTQHGETSKEQALHLALPEQYTNNSTKHIKCQHQISQMAPCQTHPM